LNKLRRCRYRYVRIAAILVENDFDKKKNEDILLNIR